MAMTTEHRKAPRRDVVDIRRVGGWGAVTYHHVLSCGHIEKRPRATKAPKLACVFCLRATEVVKTMSALSSPVKAEILDDEEYASFETRAQMIKASLASQLNVSIDAIDVAIVDESGILRVRYATIFLTEKDLRRITGL
jgi:hypothetical protein